MICSILLRFFFVFVIACFGAQVCVADDTAALTARAAKGDADAQYKLGQSFEHDRNYKEAARWYRMAVEKDHAEAANALGVLSQLGFGIEKNQEEAVMLYRKAAEKGMVSAMNNLAEMYGRGSGITQDQAEATRWFMRAAERGLATEPALSIAEWHLGQRYASGTGVTQDSREALRWLRKAIEHGVLRAWIDIGGVYETGGSIPKDQAEAVRCYVYAVQVYEAEDAIRRLADDGISEAQYQFGVIYRDGIKRPYKPTNPNPVQAVNWFGKAAELGHAKAQCALAYMYFNGAGVTKSIVLAYKWNSLAQNQTKDGEAAVWAGKFTAELAKLMTPEEITEGERLAKGSRKEEGRSLPVNKGSVSLDPSMPRTESRLDLKATGTGFFITEDGFVMTNAHVVKEGVKFQLVTRTGIIAVKVVKVDEANDLALLKAEGRFAPLPVAASRAVRLGSTVATVGFPNIGLQGFAPKLAKGEIAALSGAQDDARYFQISVPVQPGNSGGALVDERGNVVGIVSAKLSAKAALDTSGALPENVNYAVKSSFLLGFLESVPDVAAKLKEPNTKDEKFEEAVKSAEQSTVLVLVY